MPDEVITNAANKVLDVGVIGALCLILMAVLAWRERTYRADLKEWQQKLADSQSAHLADVKALADLGESVRDQMKSMVTIVQSAIEVIKERAKR